MNSPRNKEISLTIVNRLQSRAEIADLIIRYCQLFDDQDWTEFEKLWTDDASFSVENQTFEGKSNVMEFLSKCLPAGYVSKHMISQPLISVSDNFQCATAKTDVVWVAADFTNAIVGRYEDVIVNVEGQWRFRTRRETPVPYREGPVPMSEAAQSVSGQTMNSTLLRSN